jgi:fluoride ion exporter CrcB/FEX
MSCTAAGGFVGTLLRDVLTGLEHLPSPASSLSTWPQEIPWALLVINVLGVFSATRLLRGPLRHHDPNDHTRLLVITGFFGGLTSYSGLFVGLAAIWHVSVGGCLLVALGAVLSGVLAGWLGLLRRRR